MSVYEPDPIALQQLVEQNYVTRRQHRFADLSIYNYTPKTQFNRLWNEHTRACRGLILDSRYNVVARPFPKFFNIGEMETTWLDEPFEVYEKLDGSLGILYFGPDGPALATRGAFDSEQAIKGTAIFRNKYGHLLARLDPACTYLFEIIYPENRIVVDYGSQRDITLLAVIDTRSGEELPLSGCYGFPIVKRYHGLTRLALELSQLEEDTNREGYVIRFASGVRAKFKLSEYMRIHRLVTGVTPRRICEHLSQGNDIMPLMAECPPSYQQWVRRHVDALLHRYTEVERTSREVFAQRPIDGDRNANALYFRDHPHRAVLFRMLDDRACDDVIWKAIYPSAAEAFKTEL